MVRGKGSLTFSHNLNNWSPRYNQNKKKDSCSTYHPFNVFFSITVYNFLTTGRKLQNVPFNFACLNFTLPLQLTFVVLGKLCQGNFRNFQESSESRFGGSEKDSDFLKISKQQHKLVPDYNRGKLAFYFLNNAAKTCSYELKILENIEIELVFQSKVFFSYQTHFFISTTVASVPLSLLFQH